MKEEQQHHYQTTEGRGLLATLSKATQRYKRSAADPTPSLHTASSSPFPPQHRPSTTNPFHNGRRPLDSGRSLLFPLHARHLLRVSSSASLLAFSALPFVSSSFFLPVSAASLCSSQIITSCTHSCL